MRIYMDNCCFNRPFDDQSQARIRIESEAKLEIQHRVMSKGVELAWSYMLDYENQANPFEERREVIARWKAAAVRDVEETPAIVEQARVLVERGLGAKDSLHIACAIAAGCDYFLTTDDVALTRMRGFEGIRVLNPAQFVVEVG
jgi:predicted nucleic acid-binding protein